MIHVDNNSDTNEELFLAWNKFIATGKLEYNGLNHTVFNSWNRSRNYGVNPFKKNIFTIKNRGKSFHNAPKELLQSALPVMEELYDSIKGEGFLLVLTDSQGQTIRSLPDEHLFINWAENNIGTNAIGIVINTKEPMQVEGFEHYCEALHKYTSSAVPIYDLNQNMINLLGLIGPVQENHSHIISRLTKAAEKIVDRYNLLVKNMELAISNERFANILNNMSDGVIIVSSDHKVEISNPAAELILDMPSERILGTPLKELFHSDPHFIELLEKAVSFNDEEIFIETTHGFIHCIASGYPNISNEGSFDGGIIILQNIGRVQRLVNRFWCSKAEYTFDSIIGKSKLLKDTVAVAHIAAQTNSNVLLQGESGTGKEVFAQAIHNSSLYRNGPFVAINCGAIPRELIASELFGYVDGAFTGARRGGKIGKFELSNGGTIFLDEIGDMPLELQVALLRVLENKRITRIGDTKEIAVDVRVICATNKNLRALIEEGSFREDLYYRLNVISIEIPPLRERREDIPLLINHFLPNMGLKDKDVNSIIDPVALDALIKYSWPGNVRELQNVIERLFCVRRQTPITIQDLPTEILNPSNLCDNCVKLQPVNPTSKQKRKQILAEEEAALIKNLLAKFNGNITRVAAEMGVSRMTLYRKIKLYDIER